MLGCIFGRIVFGIGRIKGRMENGAAFLFLCKREAGGRKPVHGNQSRT